MFGMLSLRNLFFSERQNGSGPGGKRYRKDLGEVTIIMWGRKTIIWVCSLRKESIYNKRRNILKSLKRF